MSDNDDKARAAASRALAPAEKARPAHRAEVDEIQIPRRRPIRTAAVDKMIEGNPSLGRAWARMDKNYEDSPYQELPAPPTESTTKKALAAVERHLSEQQDGGPPVGAMPNLDTRWIHGDVAQSSSSDAEDVAFVEKPAAVVLAALPKARPAPSLGAEELAFLAFDKRDGLLTIELAWSVADSRGARPQRAVFQLRSGDPGAVDAMRLFREKVAGKRVFIWEIPPFFQAMSEFISGEFEPLHTWILTRGMMRHAMSVYSIEEDDRDRLSLQCLVRRFGVQLEERLPNKNAHLLMRLRGLMDSDVVNRAKGRDVAPLELDA